MADGITVEVKGLDELVSKLGEQTVQVAKRTLRRASKAAGDIWVAAIEGTAPVRSGFLAAHIVKKSKALGGDELGMMVVVGPSTARRGPGRGQIASVYGLMQEFGTKFAPAQPFMRPVFATTKDDVLSAFIESLTNELKALGK